MAELNRNNYNPSFETIEGLMDEHYIIPYYQRMYSWTKDQVNSLLSSFEEYYDNYDNDSFVKTKMNYIGPIVIMIDSEKPEIIDGQQRLTTILLILCVIKDMLKKIDKDYLKTDDYAEIQEEINDFILRVEKILIPNKQRKHISTKRKKIDSPRLKHYYSNEQSNFKEIITKGKKAEIRKNNLMFKNYMLIDNYFLSTFEEKGIDFKTKDSIVEGINLLCDYLEIILSNTWVLKISINDVSNAFSLFETMNNTGMSLKPFDLVSGYIKNEFKKQESDDISIIENEYNRVIEKISNIDKNSLNKYLFHWINSIKNNEVSNSNLFEVVKKYLGNVNDRSFVKKVSDMVKAFEMLNEFLSSDTKYVVKIISWLNRTKMLPIYIKLKFKNFSDKYIDNLMLQIVKYSIIELNLLGKSPGIFQYKIKDIMKFIEDQEKEMSFSEMYENIPSIKKDITEYKNRGIDEIINSSELQDYGVNKSLLLLLFENELEKHTSLNFDNIDAEHALPQKPTPEQLSSKEWKDITDEEELEKLINSIGNIKLINKTTNKMMSNSDAEDKAEVQQAVGKEADPLNSISFNFIDYLKLSPELIKNRENEIRKKIIDSKILDL